MTRKTLFKRKFLVPYILCCVIILIGIGMTLTDSASGGYLSTRLTGRKPAVMTGPSAIGIGVIAFVLIIILGRDEKPPLNEENKHIPYQSTPPSALYLQLEQTTSKIPFLKTQRLELRLFIIIPILIILAGTGIYFTILPSTIERLTTETWCMDHIGFKGKNYYPNTVMKIQIKITGLGFCNEKMDFRNDGRITLPGFNSGYINGQWAIKDDALQIFSLDTLQHIFLGDYIIDITSNRLKLQSANTIIYCSQPEKWRFPF